ncbi:MAG: hypothetical protein HRU20_23930 [Pseudomonadales bacterium]|nr:hypothetical protein [Pseudomonadales bacterium]
MKIGSIIFSLIIIGVSILNMFDLPVEIRFEETRYNYLFVMGLCFFLPFSMIMTSLSLKETKNKVLVFSTAFALSFPCSIVYFFANSEYRSIREKGTDFSFEKIREVTVSGVDFRLYRTNGGATTSYGLVLRKEVSILSGLKTVESIFSKYKASESSLIVTEDNKIQLNIEPYSKGDKVEIVTLNI